MNQNNFWIKIALIEAVIIIVLLVIQFWPVETVSMQEYNKMKIKASKARLERSAIQRVNNELIAKWRLKEAELTHEIKELTTTKTTNNEKLHSDISIINDVDLDSVIIISAKQQSIRPKGY